MVDASLNPELEKQANMRLEDCRKQKAHFELDMREGYFFAAPHRSRSVSSRSPVTYRPKDNGELNTSFASELCGDFSTVMINTFMPEAEQWAKRQAGIDIPAAAKDQVNQQAQDGDRIIFDGITASNFYSECAKCFTPDLALGTVAVWIEDARPHDPIMCQAIPAHELEISLGPNGQIDTRFHVRHTKNSYLKALIPNIALPALIEANIKNKPEEKVELRRGFWRDWSDLNAVRWFYVVMIGKTLVKTEELVGNGSCPLVVGRFNPAPEWAWGWGVLLQALPDLRSLDSLCGGKIDNVDMALRPPIAIPDDSMANFEEGIESGMAYPVRPGSETAIKNLYNAPSPQTAIYDLQEAKSAIKRLFFLDWPEQRGDTPPSATQWLDQMTMAQRRIGTPGLPFWREFCFEAYLRFQYLLEKRGTLKKIQVDGKSIALLPYNPAQRAADQQDVAQAGRAIEMLGQAFPEEWKIAVDGNTTIVNIVKALGANKLIEMRKPDDVKAAIGQLSQLTGGKPGTTTPDATQASPAVPTPDTGGPAARPLAPTLRIDART